MARKSQQDALNKIRLIFLDWDPMGLFDLGMAGLEEYDVFIPQIAKKLQKADSVEDFTDFLHTLVCEEMDDANPTKDETLEISEKLLRLNL